MPLPPRPIQRRRNHQTDMYPVTSSSLIAEARANIALLPSGASAPNRLSGVHIRSRSPLYHARPAFGGPSPLAQSPLSSASPSSSHKSRLSALAADSSSPRSEVPIDDLIVPGGRPARAGAAKSMGFDVVPDLKEQVAVLDDGQQTSSLPKPAAPKTGFWAWRERNRPRKGQEPELGPPSTPPLEQDLSDGEWEHVKAEDDDELCIVGELELDDQEMLKQQDVKAAETPVKASASTAII